MALLKITMLIEDQDLPYVAKAFRTTSKHFLRHDGSRSLRFRRYAELIKSLYHEEH